MRSLIAVWFAFAVFAGVVVGALIYIVGYSVRFGCDMKLGCSGAIAFSVTIGMMAGVLAGSAGYFVASHWKRVLSAVSAPLRVYAGMLSGVVPGLCLLLALKGGGAALLGWWALSAIASALSIGALSLIGRR